MRIEARYPRLFDFARANAFIITISVGVFTLGESVRAWALGNWVAVACGYAGLEVMAIVAIALLHRHDDIIHEHDLLPKEALQREQLTVRFASAADFPGTEQVFHEWFRASLSIPDEDFCSLMDRGCLTRIVEATIANGSQVTTRVLGSYTVWPISEETFRKLASGRLRERNIRAGMVLALDDETATVLYIPEILVSKGWDVGTPLLRDMQRYIFFLLDRHPHIARVAAWPYTRFGWRLVTDYKMTPAKSWRIGKKLFEISRARASTLPRPKSAFSSKWTIKY